MLTYSLCNNHVFINFSAINVKDFAFLMVLRLREQKQAAYGTKSLVLYRLLGRECVSLGPTPQGGQSRIERPCYLVDS